MIVDIDMKLPSLNDYVKACRTNAYIGAKMKRDVEEQIGWFLTGVPRFEHPVVIQFTWIEKDNRRDYDNIAFAKKFVLDALVKCGKLKDDNRRCVVGFSDSFLNGDRTHVLLGIKEVEGRSNDNRKTK